MQSYCYEKTWLLLESWMVWIGFEFVYLWNLPAPPFTDPVGADHHTDGSSVDPPNIQGKRAFVHSII